MSVWEYEDVFDPLQRVHSRFYKKCPACGPLCRGHDRHDRSMFEVKTLAQLLEKHSSVQRVLLAYWRHSLSVTEERIVECEINLETRLGYKPSDYK